MTHDDIREVLLLYRPGTLDAEDQQMAEAIEFAGRDPELAPWFKQHQAFQAAMRAKFRQIETPEYLKVALLTRQQFFVQKPRFWPRWVWVATAAALVLLAVGWADVWQGPKVPDRFWNYRGLMVSKALRSYALQWQTKNMGQVKQLAAAGSGPADYEVTSGLRQLELAGGAVLSWRNNPVTFVCFYQADRQMVFLFVMNKAAVKDPPALTPVLVKVRNLWTASWTRGDNTYLLAGPNEPGFSRYFPAF